MDFSFLQSPPICAAGCCCQYIGIMAVLYIVAKTFRFVKLNYFTTADTARKYAKAGNWAVVTGASDGIGKAFALELAKRKMNVVVIARTEEKLKGVVAEAGKLGVQGKHIVFDFEKADVAAYKKLFSELDKYQIALLVNNVGVSYQYPRYVEEPTMEEDLRLLKVNCEPPLMMTKYIVPRMKEKKCGAIVNISSFSSLTSTPMLSMYSGTKSFNRMFSNSLSAELAPFGIDVMSVTPHMVSTSMTQGTAAKKPKLSFVFVDAAAVAKQSLNKLGSTKQTAGHNNHCLLELMMNCIPQSLQEGQTYKMMKATRKKAEKNLAKQQ